MSALRGATSRSLWLKLPETLHADQIQHACTPAIMRPSGDKYTHVSCVMTSAARMIRGGRLPNLDARYFTPTYMKQARSGIIERCRTANRLLVPIRCGQLVLRNPYSQRSHALASASCGRLLLRTAFLGLQVAARTIVLVATYVRSAFGCDMIVSQTGRGSWTSGYREAGEELYAPISEVDYPTACSAQAFAAQLEEPVMDPSTEGLSAWSVGQVHDI